MSKESLEKFFKFFMENSEAQAKVKNFGSDVDALTAYARELGYDFSPEELREYQDKARRVLKNRMQKKLQQPEVFSSLSPGAREFYALMKLAEADESVAERLAELNTGTLKELVVYGKEKGFSFSEQDILAVGKDILEPSDELSDDELELAAGGTTVLVAFGVSAAIVLGIAAMGGAFIAFGVVGKF